MKAQSKKEIYPLQKRLDALIKLEILRMKREMGKEFNLQDTAKVLHSTGFSPSEIANILDKKGATSVAYLLYNNKSEKEINSVEGEQNVEEIK